MDGAVAVVGVGRMGAAMVARLRSGGADVVVFNRTRTRAEKVAAETGAKLADTAREAAARASVVLVSLADDRAVAEVYGGDNGIVAGFEARHGRREHEHHCPADRATDGSAGRDERSTPP